jgi:hypothetical protein
MAPHNALTIPEIRSEILTKLNIDCEFDDDEYLEDARRARRNLLSATLCCKAFKDQSLDVLWRTIPSLIPLLVLIPGVQVIADQLVSILSFQVDI